MLSASSLSSFSHSDICNSICSIISGSRLSSSATFLSRSNNLMEYQRRCSLFIFLVASSIWARASQHPQMCVSAQLPFWPWQAGCLFCNFFEPYLLNRYLYNFTSQSFGYLIGMIISPFFSYNINHVQANNHGVSSAQLSRQIKISFKFVLSTILILRQAFHLSDKCGRYLFHGIRRQ